MTPELVAYRLYRLRRLIALAMLPPMLLLAAIWPAFGLPETAVFACIAALPLIHALVYPNAWLETLAVSITATAMLALGSMIDMTLPVDDRVFRLVLLFLPGFIVFLGLVWITPAIVFAGPERSHTLRAQARSRLDPGALKSALVLQPGREGAHATCGAADAKGFFPVTLHLQKVEVPEGERVDFGPDVAVSFTEDGDAAVDYDMLCRVESSTDDCHEVIFFAHGQDEPGVARHDFRASGSGSVVELTERGGPLTAMVRLGMYLQDYMADYLESQVELAEGRPPRANRSFSARQFVIDVARLFPQEDCAASGTD